VNLKSSDISCDPRAIMGLFVSIQVWEFTGGPELYDCWLELLEGCWR